jgi:hypothetical protein
LPSTRLRSQKARPSVVPINRSRAGFTDDERANRRVAGQDTARVGLIKRPWLFLSWKIHEGSGWLGAKPWPGNPITGWLAAVR